MGGRRNGPPRGRAIVGGIIILAWSGGCRSPHEAGKGQAAAAGGAPGHRPSQTLALVVTAVDPTFVTEDHFMASFEMQLSGEPLAETMGRKLLGYRRDYACQDNVCQASLYADPALAHTYHRERIDLTGFSAAVESYEYSKQPMNNVA